MYFDHCIERLEKAYNFLHYDHSDQKLHNNAQFSIYLPKRFMFVYFYKTDLKNIVQNTSYIVIFKY